MMEGVIDSFILSINFSKAAPYTLHRVNIFSQTDIIDKKILSSNTLQYKISLVKDFLNLSEKQKSLSCFDGLFVSKTCNTSFALLIQARQTRGQSVVQCSDNISAHLL